jgi:hypothetical protein
MKFLKAFLVVVICFLLFVWAIGSFLGPDDLKQCGASPSEAAGCGPAGAIVAISGGDTSAIMLERFKAILKDKQNANTVNLGIEKYGEKDLSVAGFIEVRMQLVTRVMEPLRIKQISGTFTNITPKDLINSNMIQLLVSC